MTYINAAALRRFLPRETVAALVELVRQADESVAAAAAAQAAADAAQADADTAQTTANTGVTNAATAQTTANTGVANAATAQTTANTGVTNAAAAQLTADEAAVYMIAVPDGVVWRSDDAGAFTAGNPTADITATFYNKANSQVAQRVLRGTLTSASGTIAITAVSNSGLTSAFALVNDGTDAPKADIEVTFASGGKKKWVVSWSAVDQSVAGRTPSTGGAK